MEASAKDHRRAIVFFFAILISLGIAWKLAKELEILYVSALFAVVLMPIVNSICKLNIRGWRPSRAIGIVLMLLAVGLSLSLFFFIALPPVTRDLSQFLTDLPQRIPVAVAKLKHLPMADKLGLDTVAQKAQGAIEATASYLFTSIPMWLAHIFDIVTAAFLCLYFMLEGEHAYDFFLSLVRTSSRGRLDQTLRKAETKMSKWLLGQGLLMLTLGVTSTIVFLIFHIRYAVLLGVLMGLFNIIPVAGGIITMGLVCIVAALDSWTKLFEVVAFYLIYLNLENALLTPRIMKSSVDLMGLTVLVALLVGTALAGIVGALVAVPTAALVVVLLDEYAVKRS
ncbi:AI-2E family transporter [Granulicella aggregans]|uniref:AI-2E family transporter n=1 Tax=Granulicella aggregans TaxID=474949 RepID=UPI0021DFF64D|nr:AI-2E family transporter [Granulicella aggregans]